MAAAIRQIINECGKPLTLEEMTPDSMRYALRQIFDRGAGPQGAENAPASDGAATRIVN